MNAYSERLKLFAIALPNNVKESITMKDIFKYESIFSIVYFLKRLDTNLA